MNNVNVSVEVPLEYSISEITYDGVEILQPPLCMSENLTTLAQRIDFSSTDEDSSDRRQKEVSTRPEHDTQSSDGTFRTASTWPFESIRNKLRSSLTELSVLSDILQILSQKKYMVLDPVQSDSLEIRPTSTVHYKKKSLAAASSVLMSGAEKIKTSLNEAKPRISHSSVPDFHIELLRLRQNWRLRKMGNVILGDLSYKTVGSRFFQSGVFEVRKAENDETSTSSTDDSNTPKPTSALSVTVPKELQGIAYIQVVIQKEENVISSANIGMLGPSPAASDTRWQQRLEAAQNVLFCRELFAVLAKEAVQVSSPVPPQVVGNQISAMLFPGTFLHIGLCHGTAGKNASTNVPKVEHNHVLEHSLHQLLRDVHRQNFVIPMPHPSSGQLGVSKKRRLAGPLAYESTALAAATSKRTSILEEIIRQARHVVLKLGVMSVLDDLALQIKDPLLIAHWASLNAVVHSCVRINLVSSGYDMTARTPLIVHVKEKSLKCILKDGKAINLSYELQELRDIILSQVAIHQVMALSSLSKCMGWTVLSSSIHLGVGNCEALGNAAGCLLSSPNGRRALAVRSTPQKDKAEMEVSIGVPTNSETLSSSRSSSGLLAIGPSDTTTSGEEDVGPGYGNDIVYKRINLDNLEGKNFANKMELLMAVLSDSIK